jgi:hypothetical protein
MPEMLPAMRELRTTFWSRVEAGRRLGVADADADADAVVVVAGVVAGVVVAGVVADGVLVEEDPRPGVELIRCVVPFVQYSGEESCESEKQFKLYESDVCAASLRV